MDPDGDFRASGLRSSGLSAKSFGPEATRQKAQTTVEHLPAHPAGLPYYSVRPSPGDALQLDPPGQQYDTSPKGMPQPIVARRSSSRDQSNQSSAAAAGGSPVGKLSSSRSPFPSKTDPRTGPSDKFKAHEARLPEGSRQRKLPELHPHNESLSNPSDALPQKPEIPKLTQRHDEKWIPSYGGTNSTPPTAAEAQQAWIETWSIRQGIIESLREFPSGTGIYYRGGARWDRRDLPALWRDLGELESIMEKMNERRQGVELSPIRPFKLNDSSRGVTRGGQSGGLGGSGPITPEGDSSSGQNQHPVVIQEQVITLDGQPQTPGGGGTLVGRAGGGNQGGGNQNPQKGSGGGAGGGNDDDGTVGGGSYQGNGGEHRSRPHPSDNKSYGRPMEHRDETPPGGDADDNGDAEDGGTTHEQRRSERDPWGYIDDGVEVDVEHTNDDDDGNGLAPSPEQGGGATGNDLGTIGKLSKGAPGVTQQEMDLVGAAFGTTTGADDKDRPNTGGRPSTNTSDPNRDLGNDVGGRRMRRGTGNGGAQVSGPTEGVWWFLHGSRARPTNR